MQFEPCAQLNVVVGPNGEYLCTRSLLLFPSAPKPYWFPDVTRRVHYRSLQATPFCIVWEYPQSINRLAQLVTSCPDRNLYLLPFAGTGKSSLMCAICLGLGGAPRLLGRAKDVSHTPPYFGSCSTSLMFPPQVKHYVKNGKDTGFVEIELCVECCDDEPMFFRV